MKDFFEAIEQHKGTFAVVVICAIVLIVVLGDALSDIFGNRKK